MKIYRNKKLMKPGFILIIHGEPGQLEMPGYCKHLQVLKNMKSN